METPRLIVNRIQTPDGTILTSHHRHDYVTYTDKNGLEYMVDGGLEYARRNVHESAPYIELSVYSDAPFEIIRENFHRGGRGKDGTKPLTWVPLAKMSNAWVEGCVEYNTKLGMADSFATKLYLQELEYRKINNINIEDNDN